MASTINGIRYLTAREAAEKLNLKDLSTIKRLMEQGKLRGYMLSKRQGRMVEEQSVIDLWFNLTGYRIEATYDGSLMRIYVNGSKEAS